MENMTREEMIKELTDFCHKKPIDCRGCSIKRPLAAGYGCIKIKDRTDDQLAADMLLLPNKEPVVEKQIEVIQEPEKPRIKYMVTVDRDLLRLIRGELLMLSRCVGATITEAIGHELDEMAEAIRCEIEACDRDALAAEQAMHEALRREIEAMSFEKGETLMDEERFTEE